MSDIALPSIAGLSGPLGDQRDQRELLKKAATQFEAQFVRLLFQDLERTPIDEEPLLGDDPGSKQFTQLYHEDLGEKAAGGLGIADMVFRELSARAGLGQPPPSNSSHRSQPGQPPGKDQP